MSKLELKTDAFESKLVDDTAVIHLTGQALDILTAQKRYLAGLHRQHVFPSPEEMRTALERYYDGMVRAIAALRAETR